MRVVVRTREEHCVGGNIPEHCGACTLSVCVCVCGGGGGGGG